MKSVQDRTAMERFTLGIEDYAKKTVHRSMNAEACRRKLEKASQYFIEHAKTLSSFLQHLVGSRESAVQKKR